MPGERARRGGVSVVMKHVIEEHHESLAGTKAADKIRAVAQTANVCLFGTAVGQHPLTVRPMAVQSVDATGNLWFLSSRSSHTNQHLAQDARVQLLFANPGSSEYLTLEGTAVVSDDPALRRAHWTPIAKTWFHEGVDDSELTVIRVEPHDGYYWDTRHGKMVAAIKIALGAVMGKTTDDGVQGNLRP